MSDAIDVTERKRADVRFLTMLEGAPSAMVMLDEAGSITRVNSQTETLFGYRSEELLGKPIEMLVPERLRHFLPALRTAFFQDPKIQAMCTRLDLRVLRRDDVEVPVEIGLNPITTKEGRFVLVSVIDISERKRAETLFQAMVEGAPNVMLMIDAMGIITLANSQTEKMFGYRPEELLGKSVEMLVPERFRGRHPGQRTQFQEQPKLRAMGAGRDLYGLRRDGSELPLEIGLNPVVTEAGRFVMASIIDISARKESERQVHAYAGQLRQMSQRLLGAQEAERRSIARELHDEVGQALTAAGINVGDLERQATGGPMAVQLAEVSVIIAGLLKQIRQLSLDLHPTVLDDLGLAPAFRWLVRERAAHSGLHVVLEMPDDLPRFGSAVENTLFRVFQEGLSNVMRHAAAKNLHLNLQYTDQRAELVITDDGCGCDLVAARKRGLDGMSLGILGMEERVHLADGTIDIGSAPGHGTAIRVSLPAIAR